MNLKRLVSLFDRHLYPHHLLHLTKYLSSIHLLLALISHTVAVSPPPLSLGMMGMLFLAVLYLLSYYVIYRFCHRSLPHYIVTNPLFQCYLHNVTCVIIIKQHMNILSCKSMFCIMKENEILNYLN